MSVAWRHTLLVIVLILLCVAGWLLLAPLRHRGAIAPTRSDVAVGGARTPSAGAAAKPVPTRPSPVARQQRATTRTADEDSEAAIGSLLHDADPEAREVATSRLRRNVVERPAMLVRNLGPWLPLLYDSGLVEPLLELTWQAIREHPEDSALVSTAQRFRVRALVRLGRIQEALSEAKSAYNVAPQHDASSAVAALAGVMSEAFASTDPLAGVRFRQEQAASCSRGPAEPVAQDPASPAPGSRRAGGLSAITVNASSYLGPIGEREHSADYDGSMGRGNLLLLADRPADAERAFLQALHRPEAKGKKLFAAVDGLARAYRARGGELGRGDAFIMALRAGNPPPGLASPPGQTAIDPSQLRLAGERVPLVGFSNGNVPPPLELQRITDGARAEGGSGAVRVSSKVEAAKPLTIEQVSASHFRATFDLDHVNDWFMLRIDGARGRTIRIDLVSHDSLKKWASLNPVFSEGVDINTPGAPHRATQGTDGGSRRQAAWNGTLLPDTTGETWHFVPDSWLEDDTTFSFVHRFANDSAYVAMRPPYLPSYHQAYLRGLESRGSPYFRVIRVGQTQGYRSLDLVQVGLADDQAQKEKPCVLVYAGEHADEHDAMWVAQGLIERLLGDDEGTRSLRERCTILVIPMLDPDSTACGRHERLIGRFVNAAKLPENIAYANWFQQWVNSGRRLDLVLDLHNVQAAEASNAFCYQLQRRGIPGSASKAFNQTFMSALTAAGFAAGRDAATYGWSPDRLGGWLSRRFGCPSLHYEFNSQAPGSHLSPGELQAMSGRLLKACDEFFKSSSGGTLLRAVDSRRAIRALQWAEFTRLAGTAPIDAIESEMTTARVRVQGSALEEPDAETWIP